MIGMLEFYNGKVRILFNFRRKKMVLKISSETGSTGKSHHTNFTMEEKALWRVIKVLKTGCMGSVVWMGIKECRLVQRGSWQTYTTLRNSKYIGCK